MRHHTTPNLSEHETDTEHLNGLAWYAGTVGPIANCSIPIATHALHYGTGCIEGLRADRGPQDWAVVQLDEHLERLHRNARLLGLRPPTLDDLRQAITDLCRAIPWHAPTYVRPIVFQGGTTMGPTICPDDTHFACLARPLPTREEPTIGLHLCVSSWRRIDDNSLPARAKSTASYLNSGLARAEADRQGCDDAILLDTNGHVAESSASNVLLVRDDRVVTPALGGCLLEGLTRDLLLTTAGALGITIDQRPVARGELACADEILLCGTSLGLHWAQSVDGVALRHGGQAPGPITRQLLDAWPSARAQRATLVPASPGAALTLHAVSPLTPGSER